MHSKEEALSSVNKGNTWGYIEFPQNYSSSLTNKYAFGNFPDNESLLNSEISFHLDYSSKYKDNTIV